MAKCKIETGIPMPSTQAARRNRGESKYPFTELAIGQSFFVKSIPKSFSAHSSKRGRDLGMKFATRRMDGGLRVWRVE